MIEVSFPPSLVINPPLKKTGQESFILMIPWYFYNWGGWLDGLTVRVKYSFIFNDGWLQDLLNLSFDGYFPKRKPVNLLLFSSLHLFPLFLMKRVMKFQFILISFLFSHSYCLWRKGEIKKIFSFLFFLKEYCLHPTEKEEDFSFLFFLTVIACAQLRKKKIFLSFFTQEYCLGTTEAFSFLFFSAKCCVCRWEGAVPSFLSFSFSAQSLCLSLFLSLHYIPMNNRGLCDHSQDFELFLQLSG